MSDDPQEIDWESITWSEHEGVRTFYMVGPSAAELAGQIAMVVGEHSTDDDELHLAYSTQQVGWVTTPGQAGSMFKARQDPYTVLQLEYSAMLVLRPRAVAGRGGG